MAEQFYTILTAIGKAKIANAATFGEKVELTHLALGDGGGSYYNPTEDQTELRNEVWRGVISTVTVDEENPNWITIQTVVPGQHGGFMIREAGVFDNEGNLIAVGKYPETYKPVAADGSIKDLVIRMILEVSNTSSVVLKIDPTAILATQQQVDAAEARAKAYTDREVAKVSQALDAHVVDYMLQIPYTIATGSANNYSVLLNGVDSYYEGMAIAVKINVNNTGASTINVNGLGAKAIKKPNGSDVTAGNLKAGSIYSMRYNGINFILQGSDAAGNATPGDVLSGKTFSNDQGEQVGTMPNRGKVIITPSTVNQAIPMGFHDGTGYVKGDSNLKASNIKKGITIFGVTGTLGQSLVTTQTGSTRTAPYISGTGITNPLVAVAIDEAEDGSWGPYPWVYIKNIGVVDAPAYRVNLRISGDSFWFDWSSIPNYYYETLQEPHTTTWYILGG